MHWNGVNWSNLPKLTTINLQAVDVLSSTEGWIVGDNGAVGHWDGATWNPVTSPTLNDLWAVSAVSPTDAWIVGDDGTILHWDGSELTQFPSPTFRSLYAVSMLSATDGWIVGCIRHCLTLGRRHLDRNGASDFRRFARIDDAIHDRRLGRWDQRHNHPLEWLIVAHRGIHHHCQSMGRGRRSRWQWMGRR